MTVAAHVKLAMFVSGVLVGICALTVGWSLTYDPPPATEVRVEKVVCVIPAADHAATECRQVRP